MADGQNRSPSEIERDIEDERSALTKTLESLQDSLSFDSFLHTASDSVRKNGGEIGRSLGNSVKANPVALALTGAGIAWLVFGPSSSSSSSSSPARRRHPAPAPAPVAYDPAYRPTSPGLRRDPYSSDFDARVAAAEAELEGADAGRRSYTGTGTIPGSSATSGSSSWSKSTSRLSRAKSKARGSLSHARHKATGAYYDARGKVSGKASEAKYATKARLHHAKADAKSGYYSAQSSASEGAGRVSSAVHDLRERISEGTEHMSDEARRRVIAARERAIEARISAEQYYSEGSARARAFYHDQPLVVGAAFLALGAAVGAALPRTRFEDDTFGDYSDHMMDEAEAIYRDERERLERAAKAAAGEAETVARETMAQAREAAPDMPDGRAAVDEAEAKAKETAARIGNAAQKAHDKD
ncbi:DUF3618 domain-containing protein [Roseicyclus sp. F158]|uniref:DUF3618 domain-containing protein n=1 Tax=Tropicimonas omnivorans TaxID=3075590 RepID=A0ABU3DGT7_9RHOB|nr:DUF3618 domain-containing protein [Roseicyclus sp. F158]MDT0682768.1 DUF3618 domain-containing protein [Roseicyclus sp. F158]